MAVPTVYAKFLEHSKRQNAVEQKAVRTALSSMRLHVSGSAALPVSGIFFGIKFFICIKIFVPILLSTTCLEGAEWAHAT